jgi:hypothetical protein
MLWPRWQRRCAELQRTYHLLFMESHYLHVMVARNEIRSISCWCLGQYGGGLQMQAKNPAKDMPIGIVGATTVCTILYIIMCIVSTFCAPQHIPINCAALMPSVVICTEAIFAPAYAAHLHCVVSSDTAGRRFYAQIICAYTTALIVLPLCPPSLRFPAGHLHDGPL